MNIFISCEIGYFSYHLDSKLNKGPWLKFEKNWKKNIKKKMIFFLKISFNSISNYVRRNTHTCMNDRLVLPLELTMDISKRESDFVNNRALKLIPKSAWTTPSYKLAIQCRRSATAALSTYSRIECIDRPFHRR